MFTALVLFVVLFSYTFVPRGIARIRNMFIGVTFHFTCQEQDELETLPSHIAEVVWKLSAGEISFAKARNLLGISAYSEMEVRLFELQKSVSGHHTFVDGQIIRKRIWVRMVR